MVRCPNCGRKTSGDNCQWCKYPILKGRQKEAVVAAREKIKREAEEARKAKEAEKQAKKETVVAAREKAKQEVEEAKKAKEAEKQAKKEAVVAAREKAKREAEEARKAKQAEKQARKEAEIAAREKAKREAEEQASKEAVRVLLSQIHFDQVKHLEECIKELESTREELRAGKIGAEEAIQRFRDISERISK